MDVFCPGGTHADTCEPGGAGPSRRRGLPGGDLPKAELAAGAPVTVIGTGAESEQPRRAVALAMSALQDAGVAAFGQVSVTASPGRSGARLARARGARVVVLDRCRVPDPAFAAELRRRMYGSGITVLTPAERP